MMTGGAMPRRGDDAQEGTNLRAFVMVMLGATALLAQAIGLASGISADQQTRQIVRIGSITLYVPQDWLSSTSVTVVLKGGGMVTEPSNEDYIAESVAVWGRTLDTLPYVRRMQLPFQIGTLTANPGTLESQKKEEAEWIAKASAREDSARGWDDNILEIQPGLYLLIGSESTYRLEQAFIVRGLLSTMNSQIALDRTAYVRYRIAPDISIRLMFDLRDFPPEKWAELDRDVQTLISFLTTPG